MKSAVEALVASTSRTSTEHLQDSWRNSIDCINEYEKMIQRLEEEARNHVRLEQQLKLQIESFQFKVDELEHSKKAIEQKLREYEKKLEYSSKEWEEEEHKTLRVKFKRRYGKSLDKKSITELNTTNIIGAKLKETEIKNILKFINSTKAERTKNNNNSQTIHNNTVQKEKFMQNEPATHITNLKNELNILHTELKKKRTELRPSSTKTTKNSIRCLNQPTDPQRNSKGVLLYHV